MNNQVEVSLVSIRESVGKIAQFPITHMLTEVKEALRNIIAECSKIEAELKEKQ
jgi:phosphoribosylaminoimidazole carboxylase (NCAIR synthetase)